MSDAFNWQWRLPPRPGFPGYKAPAPPQGQPSPQNYYQRLYPPPQKPIGPIDAGSAADPGAGADAEPYEPFIPSREDRPYNQWGTDDFALAGARNYPGIARGPLMPQMRDIAGLIHSAVMGLGRFGSHYTGMPAIAMGTYANAYWTAYQKGMRERAGDAYQQYRMARQMTIDRGKEEMEEYTKIYGAYHDEKGKITDPDAFSHELLAAAHKYQNRQLISAIESGNLPMADRILGATDSHIINLIKAQHQEEQQRKLNEERDLRIKIMQKQLEGGSIPEEWKDIPASPETTRNIPDDDTTVPKTEDDDTKTKPEDDTTGAKAGDDSESTQTQLTRGGPTTTGAGATPPVAPATPTQGQAINPLVKEAADELVRTGKIPAGVPKPALQKVGTEAAKQKAALGNLIDKGILTGNNENSDLAAIRKINPRVADDVEMMGHGQRPVPSGGENLYANMEGLAHKVYPHWDAGIYEYIKDFRKGPESKIYESVGTLKNAAEGVLRELQNLDENASPPRNWIDKETGRVSAEASAKWGALANALFQYVEESITIQNGGRRPLASQTAREILAFPTTRGAKTIRALLTTSAIADVGRINAANHAWHSNTHLNEPPPGYDEHSASWARALADMDYNTGYMKNPNTPVPDDMKPYLGPAGSNLHKGGTPNMPKVKTPEDAAKLPSGTKFIMPDGRIGTVP